MGLVKIYPCTEFEVSIFTRSKFTEGGLKLKNSALDPDQAPFRGILSFMRWDLPMSICVPNLNSLASPVPKIRHTCLELARCARGCA